MEKSPSEGLKMWLNITAKWAIIKGFYDDAVLSLQLWPKLYYGLSLFKVFSNYFSILFFLLQIVSSLDTKIIINTRGLGRNYHKSFLKFGLKNDTFKLKCGWFWEKYSFQQKKHNFLSFKIIQKWNIGVRQMRAKKLY